MSSRNPCCLDRRRGRRTSEESFLTCTGAPVMTKIQVGWKRVWERDKDNAATVRPMLRLLLEATGRGSLNLQDEGGSTLIWGQREIPRNVLGRVVHHYYWAPGHNGAHGRPEWITKLKYVVETCELREFSDAPDCLLIQENLLKGTIPSTFPESIR